MISRTRSCRTSSMPPLCRTGTTLSDAARRTGGDLHRTRPRLGVPVRRPLLRTWFHRGVNGRRTGPANARLVRPPIAEAPTFTWDSGARRVLSAPGGFLRVLGGPGTGKTTLLASAATRRIAEGADPESVLVLTTSRKAADALRADITRSLTADPDLARPLPRTVREPLVRTVHSYAYSLLRLEAMGAELPAPRLLMRRRTGRRRPRAARRMTSTRAPRTGRSSCARRSSCPGSPRRCATC